MRTELEILLRRFRLCDFWDIALFVSFHSQVLFPNDFLYQGSNLSGTLGLVRLAIHVVYLVSGYNFPALGVPVVPVRQCRFCLISVSPAFL